MLQVAQRGYVSARTPAYSVARPGTQWHPGGTDNPRADRMGAPASRVAPGSGEHRTRTSRPPGRRGEQSRRTGPAAQRGELAVEACRAGWQAARVVERSPDRVAASNREPSAGRLDEERRATALRSEPRTLGSSVSEADSRASTSSGRSRRLHGHWHPGASARAGSTERQPARGMGSRHVEEQLRAGWLRSPGELHRSRTRMRCRSAPSWRTVEPRVRRTSGLPLGARSHRRFRAAVATPARTAGPARPTNPRPSGRGGAGAADRCLGRQRIWCEEWRSDAPPRARPCPVYGPVTIAVRVW